MMPNFSIAWLVNSTNPSIAMTHRDPVTDALIYPELGNEAIIVNTQAAALAALGIIVPVMIALRPFRRRWNDRLTEHLWSEETAGVLQTQL